MRARQANVLPRKVFRVRWDQVGSLLVTLLCLGLFMAWFMLLIEPAPERAMPACATEDSDNCFWDAETMGNGEGRSFIVVDGVVDYLP